jgi:hypothetical protein
MVFKYFYEKKSFEYLNTLVFIYFKTLPKGHKIHLRASVTPAVYPRTIFEHRKEEIEREEIELEMNRMTANRRQMIRQWRKVERGKEGAKKIEKGTNRAFGKLFLYDLNLPG